MKSTFLITLISTLYFSTAAFGQTTTKLEALAKDPSTAEMAAKADIYTRQKN